MKYLDSFLVICAFALSTILTASMFAVFAAWAYGVLGPYERDVIAEAASLHRTGAASVTAARSPRDAVAEVQFEPITVIGHRSEVGPQIAASAAAAIN